MSKIVEKSKPTKPGNRNERLFSAEPQSLQADWRPKTARLLILPEFLLEMYLTSSQAPEARRRRKKRDKVFISPFSTGTFRTQRTKCFRRHNTNRIGIDSNKQQRYSDT